MGRATIAHLPGGQDLSCGASYPMCVRYAKNCLQSIMSEGVVLGPFLKAMLAGKAGQQGSGKSIVLVLFRVLSFKTCMLPMFLSADNVGNFSGTVWETLDFGGWRSLTSML